VHLPRGFEQGLQAEYLLLQIDGFAVTRKLKARRHGLPPWKFSL
jgi:hypothetical protein